MSSSTSSSRVPELVGGGGHSRNLSVASTTSSLWSASALSRNASTVSSASSRRGYGGNVNVDTVIMEADDEEEWLVGNADTRPYAPPPKKGHKRRHSGNNPSRKKLEPLGMGKDMRDVLEEIIQMEKVFVVDDQDGEEVVPGPFTAAFDRPPRTPSPLTTEREKRMSVIQQAPGAPIRGHRSTHSNPLASPRSGIPQRPPSIIGMHQASLSESHTALYLATASPVKANRRSASPKLQARQSITFTPDAGPSIFNLPIPSHRSDSSMGNGSLTPNRRRLNLTPAHHPAMKQWRFPASGGYGSATATPTRPTHLALPVQEQILGPNDRVQPHLLWPPPPNLQPSLFPSSPAVDTPETYTQTRRGIHSSLAFPTTECSPEMILPPNSGLRLGELLGSGHGGGAQVSDGMDVEMEEADTDDWSTAHGHGDARGRRGTYLPVFLEAEGFQSTYRRW